MNEEKAWLNFINTGLVKDYLIYSKMKIDSSYSSQEDAKNANEYKRIDYCGKKCWRT